MATKTLSRAEKIIETKKSKARRLSIIEASAYSVSDGFGLRNIAPYALALNASNSMMGLLTSLPSLLGNISQLITHRLLGRYSRKKVVVFSVFLQAFFWLALLIPGVLLLNSKVDSNLPTTVLLALYTALVVSGAIAGPAWNSWMKDLVPEKELGTYFAKRSKMATIVAFSFMILAGLILDYFNNFQVIYGFFILLFFSGIFRGLSGYLFTKQYEPPFKANKKAYFSLASFISNMPFNNFGRFVLFISLLNFSVAIASPFFAVYLLKEKSFSYIGYMLLNMIMPITTILAMNYWGRKSDPLGNVKIFRITGIFIILVPMVYFISSVSSNILIIAAILIPIEILSGFGWSGFNLSASNFVLKTVSRDKMVLCASYMNVLNGFSIVIGATLGGILASMQIWNPILVVFLVSGFGRLIVYLSILPKLKERISEKSIYEPGEFFTHLSLVPRYVYNLGDTFYTKTGLEKLSIRRLFRFIKN